MVGDANGSGDDVTFSGSFGWMFSTVTAFGLLVFLVVSFVCYHRRLATRKAREDEYAEFVRTYRPDLDSKGLKKPRATINAYSARKLAISSSEKSPRSYINEGFEFGLTNEYVKPTASTSNFNQRIEEDIDYMINSEIQLQQKIIQNRADEFGNLPKIRGHYPENRILPNSIATASVHTNIDNDRVTQRYDNENQHVDNSNERHESSNDTYFEKESEHYTIGKDKSNKNARVKHKPPAAPKAPPMQLEAESLGGDKTNGVKKLKKKRQMQAQSAARKDALSYDDDVPYLFNHYKTPSRQSEPSPFLHTHDGDSNIKRMEQSIQYNPYYLEMGTRLEYPPSLQKYRQRRNTQEQLEAIDCNSYNQNQMDYDVSKSVYETNDAYNADIENSTWM